MRQRLLTITALLLGLILLLGAGLYGLREVLVGPRLLAAANSYLAPALGVELRAGKIGGNYFNSLELQDIYTEKAAAASGNEPAAGAQPPPRLELQARQLRLSYHLPALRHGPAAFMATLSIELSRGRLLLEPSPGQPPAATPEPIRLPELAALNQLLDSTTGLIAGLPTISLRQLDFHLHGGESAPTLEAAAMALDFVPAGVATGALSRLTLQSPAGSLHHPHLHPLRAPLELELLARTGQHGGSLTISRLDWEELLTVHTGRLTWSGRPDGEAGNLRSSPAGTTMGTDHVRLDLELDLQVLATEVKGEAELTPANWRTELTTGSFQLAELATILAQPRHLSGEIRAAGRLDFSPADPLATLAGELALEVREGSMGDHRLDDLDLQAEISRGTLHLPRLAVRLGDNHLELHNLRLPLAAAGDGDLRQLLEQGQLEALQVDFHDLPELLAAAGLSPGRQLEPVPAPLAALARHRFTLQAALDQGRLSLRDGRLEGEAGHLLLPRAVIGPWPADDDFWQLPMEGEAHLVIEDLHTFTSLWQLPALDGRLQAELTMQGSPSAPQGELNLAGSALSWREFTLEQLQLALANEGTLERPRLTASLQLHNLRQPGHGRQAPSPELEEFAVEFSLDEERLTVRRLALRHGDDHLLASGRLRLPPDTRLDFSELAALKWATLELRELQATLTVAELNAYADWLPEQFLPAGRQSPAAPDLPDPGQTDPGPAEQPAAIPASPGPFGALTVELSGDGTLADHGFATTVKLTNGQLADFSLQSWEGRFDFSLPGAELANLRLAGDFLARELHQAATPLFHELTAELRLAAGQLTVQQGELVSPHGRVRLAGELDGLGAELMALRLDQLELTTDELALGLAAPARLHFTTRRLLDAELELQGHGAALSLRGGYDPATPGAELDFQARLKSDDLSWLSPLLPGIRRLDGSVVAELELGGSPADPRAHGTILLTDGELRPLGDAPALREIRAEASFDHRGLELISLDGRWGGAPLAIRGRIDFPPDFPLVFAAGPFAEALQFDLILQGEELLFYRAEGIRVRGRTNLTLSGPLTALHLAGEVAISDGRYTRQVDFLEMFRAPGGPQRQRGLGLFSLTTPPWRQMTLNIRLTADQPLVVANNMARGSLRPDLRLRGSGELPVLNGEIYLDPTRIILPSGRFQIQSGLIRFPAHDPDRPEFDLLATARLLGYDINLVLQGTADEPVLTLSSIPPLPDDELLLLVLTGQPPAAIGEEARRRAGMNMALFLGRDMLGRIFHGDEPPSDEAILERFHIEMGRNITRSGDETIEAELRLADDLVRDGDRLFITSEKDIYDDFNIGLKLLFRFR